MLILDDATRSLRVRLGAAHTTSPLRCVTSWRDTTTIAFTPGSTLSSTNGTTGVEIAPAPAASTQRAIDFVSVLNTDTVSHTVTIYVFNGTTDFDLIRVTIGVGERVQYVEGLGFATYTAAGSQKTLSVGTQNVVSSGWSATVLGADQTNNNATANTMQDVTGLSFAVVAGTRYWFEFMVVYSAAATTTGIRLGINGPASPTLLALRFDGSLTSTSRGFSEGVSTYDGGTVLPTSAATGLANIGTVQGLIQPSVDGTVIARFASEVSSSAVVIRAGSMVRFIAA